jgi:hypothetical protein
MKNCNARFREHCIERHGLGEADTDARIFFSLDERTPTIEVKRRGALPTTARVLYRPANASQSPDEPLCFTDRKHTFVTAKICTFFLSVAL